MLQGLELGWLISIFNLRSRVIWELGMPVGSYLI